jgi:hypothetical protein
MGVIRILKMEHKAHFFIDEFLIFMLAKFTQYQYMKQPNQ